MSRNKRERIQSVFLYGVFICYFVLLMKILLFSRIAHTELRSINLIPFKSILNYLSGSTANAKAFAFGNVIGNIVIFIPFGVYLPLFKKDKRILPNLLILGAVSLLVEIIQGIFGIGTADIDDLILNCLGGLIGISGYRLLLFWVRDEKKIRTAITILSAVGLPAIVYYLFMVRMRF